ncbi:MAG: type IV pilus twitching motility protein PilT [Deltaproteobacteria bacterium]|nr:type IV pilus twitching motility protein PilT [Deltaproteobacteria bacterium]
MELDTILAQSIARLASDVHLKVGRPPMYRIHGTLMPMEDAPVLDAATLNGFAAGLVDDYHQAQFRERLQADLAYSCPSLGRFRVNIFRQRGEVSIALRVIPPLVRNIRDLNLPPVVERIALEHRGLVLVTGTTGSGKSTTLAAMIDHINQQRDRHIITIEDPIEYTHRDDKCIINQREIGYDARTFADALRGALRQDPDVILVGEMRDLETIETAILAAETGHLVMSTLHTLDARETITRAISAFPEHQRDQMRLILSSVVRGIISQRLVKRADGEGMVPAVEVLLSTALTRECIAIKEKTHELHDAIARGHATYGMQTFDQSLMALYRQGLITYEEAIAQATNPDDFALKIRGIGSASDAHWDTFDKSAQPAENGQAAFKIDRF